MPSVISTKDRARFQSLVVAHRVGVEMKPFTPRYVRNCRKTGVRFLTPIHIFWFVVIALANHKNHSDLNLPKASIWFPLWFSIWLLPYSKHAPFSASWEQLGAETPRDLVNLLVLMELSAGQVIVGPHKSPTSEGLISSVQFSSVTQSCPTLCDPMNHSTPGLPVHHQLLELTQTHDHWVNDAIQPTHPLLSPSYPALNLSQHEGLFQWVSSSHPVAKVLEFQLQYQSFQWIFRVDFLYPYMTTGKTIALARRTSVDKVMSLLFNMLSRLVITFLPRSVFLLQYTILFLRTHCSVGNIHNSCNSKHDADDLMDSVPNWYIYEREALILSQLFRYVHNC